MPSSDQKFELYKDAPSFRLLSDPLRLPVERRISEHYGRGWRIRTFEDMHDFSSHPAAILSDGRHSVFVKLSEAPHALDQFEVELAGLRLLNQLSGALIPEPIDLVPVPNGFILILEAVRAVERTARHWQDIGRALARIHLIEGDRCGLDRQGYFGPLYQDNRPMPDWLSFYCERRIWPRFIGAIDSGNLPLEMIRQVEKLILRLPELDIPETAPRLLHGDAQQNNFISTEMGAMVIDPAVYFGNPEIDLAYIDYFQPVPDEVFAGYQEIMPIHPGFSERRDLWRVSAYLAAIEVEGSSTLHLLSNAVQKYL